MKIEWEKIFASEVTQQEINLQNIQKAHAAQYKKKNPKNNNPPPLKTKITQSKNGQKI